MRENMDAKDLDPSHDPMINMIRRNQGKYQIKLVGLIFIFWIGWNIKNFG